LHIVFISLIKLNLYAPVFVSLPSQKIAYNTRLVVTCLLQPLVSVSFQFFKLSFQGAQ